MTDEQVIDFVNGCKVTIHSSSSFSLAESSDYPAYELYTDGLREGVFGKEKGKLLRLSIGKLRKVKSVQK